MRGASHSGTGERKTNHHFYFVHGGALPDHEPSFLNAELAIPQSPRLTVGNDAIRTSMLSDVGLWCPVCRCLGRDRLSGSVNADCNFCFFVVRYPIFFSTSANSYQARLRCLHTFEFDNLGKPQSRVRNRDAALQLSIFE